MDQYIEILNELKQEIEKDLQSDHLVNNRVAKNQPIVDKIIGKKKSQIKALAYAIKHLNK